MKISEKDYTDFFKEVVFRDTVLPSTGEVFPMPLTGEKAIQMAAMFTASRSKVMNVLPVPELVPVELPGDQTIIGFIGIEYLKRNIPSYNEVIVIVPVLIGRSVTPPTLEDLLKEDYGGCTFFIRHIAVDTRISMLVGNELLGYNKFIGDIRFITMPEERICVLSDAGEEILKFSVCSKVEIYGEWERSTMSIVTCKHGELSRLTYQSQTRYGIDMPVKGSLTLGPHPLGKILSSLDISCHPIYTIYSPYFQLISDNNNLETVQL